MRTVPECQFGAAVALVQPEPSTEMRKEKINIHLVSRKCVGSCTLEWGQEQELLGLCPREAMCHCSPGSGGSQ